MSVLLDLIKTQLNDSHYASFGQAIGADPAQTKSAVDQALPVLLGALSNKATSNTSLDFVTSLLDKNHDGSVLDDILGMVTGGGSAPQAEAPGAAALKSLLGNQVSTVENHVAQNSGLNADAVTKLLPMLATVVMGALTKAQSSQNLSGQGLRSFLEKESSSIAQNQPQTSSFLASILDQNHDGSVIDDIARMGAGFLGGLRGK